MPFIYPANVTVLTYNFLLNCIWGVIIFSLVNFVTITNGVIVEYSARSQFVPLWLNLVGSLNEGSCTARQNVCLPLSLLLHHYLLLPGFFIICLCTGHMDEMTCRCDVLNDKIGARRKRLLSDDELA